MMTPQEIVELYLARQAGRDRPAGWYGEDGWRPSPEEECPLCQRIRPTPGRPRARRQHCCTIAHLCAREGVSVWKVRRLLRAYKVLGVLEK